MTPITYSDLSRRERQIMDILFERGRATALEVQELLPDPPSYSAVRALLRVMEEKGAVRHEKDGAKYVYSTTLPREKTKSSALKQMVQTFFDGSVEETMAALLDISRDGLSSDELDRLAHLVEQARKEGR